MAGYMSQWERCEHLSGRKTSRQAASWRQRRGGPVSPILPLSTLLPLLPCYCGDCEAPATTTAPSAPKLFCRTRFPFSSLPFYYYPLCVPSPLVLAAPASLSCYLLQHFPTASLSSARACPAYLPHYSSSGSRHGNCCSVHVVFAFCFGKIDVCWFWKFWDSWDSGMRWHAAFCYAVGCAFWHGGVTWAWCLQVGMALSRLVTGLHVGL